MCFILREVASRHVKSVKIGASLFFFTLVTFIPILLVSFHDSVIPGYLYFAMYINNFDNFFIYLWIDDKFRKYRLQDFVHHFSKCDHSEQNQLVLSFRAIFVICLSEISGWTYLEIFPSETSVVSHKDKFIHVSLHLILTEKLEQVRIIVKVHFYIIQLSRKEIYSSKKEYRSSLIVFT